MASVYILVGLFFFFFPPFAEGTENCVRFQFPDIGPNLTVTAEEGADVKVNFRLIFGQKTAAQLPTARTTITTSTTTVPNNYNKDGDDDDDDDDETSCALNETRMVMVTKVVGHEDYCILRVHPSGGCTSFHSQQCRCLTENGGDDAGAGSSGSGGSDSDGNGGEGGAVRGVRVQFTKRVGRGDAGWWLWWSRSSRGQAEVKVFFKVVPPSPTSGASVLQPSSSGLDWSFGGPIIAAVVISVTVVIAAIVIVNNKRRERRHAKAPQPCGLAKMTSLGAHVTNEYATAADNPASIYDEIGDVTRKTVVTPDMSIYLHPVDCVATATPTPSTTTSPTTPTTNTTTTTAPAGAKRPITYTK